jgi:uncharacterized OB-fold protein
LLSNWRKREERKFDRIRIERRPKNWNRKCKACGKDPWPNYFYCMSCHPHVIDRYERAGFGGRGVI